MGTNYNPQIVTSGLVLAIDAANRKSYPGSGASWNDLSGNNNHLTLYNSPTFGPTNQGTISFNGTTQYAGIANTSCSNNFKSMTNGYTTIVGFRSNESNAGWHSICSFGDGLNYVDLWYNAGSGCFGSDAQSHYPSTAPLINAGFNIYTHSYSGTVSKIYRNGVLLDTKNITQGVLASGQYNFCIAASPETPIAYYHNMDVNFFTIYNTVLTDEQVLQNFNAIKGRYGL
jgi:hypothetical protein